MVNFEPFVHSTVSVAGVVVHRKVPRGLRRGRSECGTSRSPSGCKWRGGGHERTEETPLPAGSKHPFAYHRGFSIKCPSKYVLFLPFQSPCMYFLEHLKMTRDTVSNIPKKCGLSWLRMDGSYDGPSKRYTSMHLGVSCARKTPHFMHTRVALRHTHLALTPTTHSARHLSVTAREGQQRWSGDVVSSATGGGDGGGAGAGGGGGAGVSMLWGGDVRWELQLTAREKEDSTPIS